MQIPKQFFETTLGRKRISEMVETGVWSDRFFDSVIDHWAKERGEQIAVTDRHGSTTWSELATQVDEVSRGLLELGVRPGVVVQVQLPNWCQFLVSVAAVERIGGVINPVAPIFRTNEVLIMSELAKPGIVITATEFRGFELAQMHIDLRERCSWVKEIITVGERPLANALSWEELLEQGRFSSYDRAAVNLLRAGSHDVCEVMFTSGTTGQPKGVMHTQSTLNAAVDCFVEAVCEGLTPASEGLDGPGYTFHMASTLAHQTGYLFGIRAPLTLGGHVVLQDVWDPGELVELIEQHQIQISMGATPFLADILGVEKVEERNLTSWKRFVCAGAAVPEPVLEDADARLPCVVLPGWGMTECGLLTAGRPSDSLTSRLTDGTPFAGNEVRVVTEQSEAVLGVEGDLQCRGSLLFAGYVQGRELTEGSWDGSWFKTGDRAVMNDDGSIRITGRSKDIIIRGGENIPVKEVEDLLLRHPQVLGVAIVGKPDERLGETGCAFVIAADKSPTLDALTEFLEVEGVTRQFWPEDLVLVEEFPMTPSGKVQKYKLREEFLAK